MLEKRVATIGKVFFGFAGLLAGDAKGAASLAEVAAGVIDRERAAGREPEAVFARAMAAHGRAWAQEYASPADREAVEAVEALLEGSLAVVLDPDALAAAAFDPRGLHEAAAAAVSAALGLDDPRQHSDAARRYAGGLLAAGLKAAFDAGGLFDRFAQRLAVEQARRIGLMQAKLEQIDAGIRDQVPRELLESLVLRFDYGQPDAPVAELAAFLKAKAGEWKDLKARLATLEAEDPRIGKTMEAAEQALANGDFDQADYLLAQAEELQQEHRTLVEVRRQAGIRLARADARLLNGDADGAADHIEAAAEYLLPFAPTEAAEVRKFGAARLHDTIVFHGGTRASRAIELYRRNLTIWSRDIHPEEWARTQHNLGYALRNLGGWTAGPAGDAFLKEAVDVYEAALEVRTPETNVFGWALTQDCLGNVFHAQAIRGEGDAAMELLGRSVAAHEAAIHGWRMFGDPVRCAEALTHLGNTLATQAGRSGVGEAGAELLSKAVEAQNSAIYIYEGLDLPVPPTVLGNRALALMEQARRIDGEAGAKLLSQCMSDHEGVVRSLTKDDQPVQWAAAQNNLGRAFEELGDRGDAPARRYAEALASFDRALDVFVRLKVEVLRESCEKSRARVVAKLASAER